MLVNLKNPWGEFFSPNGGVRARDSIMGNTKLAKEWPLHPVPPTDYKDFVLAKDLERDELLRAQAHAAVSFLLT